MTAMARRYLMCRMLRKRLRLGPWLRPDGKAPKLRKSATSVEAVSYALTGLRALCNVNPGRRFALPWAVVSEPFGLFDSGRQGAFTCVSPLFNSLSVLLRSRTCERRPSLGNPPFEYPHGPVFGPEAHTRWEPVEGQSEIPNPHSVAGEARASLSFSSLPSVPLCREQRPRPARRPIDGR